jgi:hypothetical protein
MTMLVDLDTAKLRLRVDHDAEDDSIELAIKGASGAVLNYLKLDRDYYEDSNGDVVDVPEEVQNATILLAGILVRDPSGTEMKDWEMGYLPRPVMALLYPLRDPALS